MDLGFRLVFKGLEFRVLRVRVVAFGVSVSGVGVVTWAVSLRHQVLGPGFSF